MKRGGLTENLGIEPDKRHCLDPYRFRILDTGSRLRSQDSLAGCVALSIESGPGEIRTRACRIPEQPSYEIAALASGSSSTELQVQSNYNTVANAWILIGQSIAEGQLASLTMANLMATRRLICVPS